MTDMRLDAQPTLKEVKELLTELMNENNKLRGEKEELEERLESGIAQRVKEDEILQLKTEITILRDMICLSLSKVGRD